MAKSSAAIIGLILASTAFAQPTVNMDAIEKQQQKLIKQVTLVRYNFGQIWDGTYPAGSPFHTENREAERKAAWAPKYKVGNDYIAFNNGLRCISFIGPKDSPAVPDICGPVDLQANLAMDALLEDWENLQQVPADKQVPFGLVRDDMLMLWAEEKALYCALQPNSTYFTLAPSTSTFGDSTSERCTPIDPNAPR